jgi:hypothetical protein
MPKSETDNRVFAISFSKVRNPIAANTGPPWTAQTVGLVLWASTQIEQEALSVLFGWL